MLLLSVKRRLGVDGPAAAGTVGTALVLVVFALLRIPETAVATCLVAGMSWIAVHSSLNVSTQTALPDWVRAHRLSVFITIFLGSMTLGSMA